MRIRARKPTDRDFFVQLLDEKDKRKVAIGNFYAESAGEACDMARRKYHGLFESMETNSYTVTASEIFPSYVHKERM